MHTSVNQHLPLPHDLLPPLTQTCVVCAQDKEFMKALVFTNQQQMLLLVYEVFLIGNHLIKFGEITLRKPLDDELGSQRLEHYSQAKDLAYISLGRQPHGDTSIEKSLDKTLFLEAMKSFAYWTTADLQLFGK